MVTENVDSGALGLTEETADAFCNKNNQINIGKVVYNNFAPSND
jgi:hypothetical protein